MPVDAPELEVKPARRSFWERASIVWLVPVAALLVAVAIAAQTWLDRGPLIVVTLEEALGVKARETELRFRDVAVGSVEEVRFAEDLERVEVSIRLEKDIAAYIDDDAVFWVVRPKVTAQGVTGLDTVLSGVFLEGIWDSTPEGFVERHEGLADAPLLRPGEEGMLLSLKSQADTTLAEGTAILFKGIEVGRVGKPELAPGAAHSRADAVIYAPYDQLVSSTTRFWDTSGFRFSIGATGANLDFSSIASLISGGVAFDTVVSGGVPVQGQPSFDVFASEEEARTSLFSDSLGPVVNVSIVFDENASGLSVGAPVELRGIDIGEVTGVNGLLDPLRFRDRKVRLLVNAEIRPSALGLPDGTSEEAVLDFIDEQVQRGLRARLASASILTGGLKIELFDAGEVASETLDRTGDPFPIIPATANRIADPSATAQGVLQRVTDLPIEELMESAITFLDDAAALVRNGDLAAIPGDVRAVIGDVREVTGSDEVQAIPAELSELMTGLRAATDDLRAMVRTLNDAQAVDRVLAAVDSAGAAAGAVTSSVEGVPELVTSLTDTAETARALPLEDLIAQATGVLDRAEALLAGEDLAAIPGDVRDTIADLREVTGSEEVAALPGELSAMMTDFRNVASDLRAMVQTLQDAEAVERVLAAVDSAGEAAGAVTSSVEGVPELVTSLTDTAETARALPLEDLIAQATAVLSDAEALLAGEDLAAIPRDIRGAIADVREVTGSEEVRALPAEISAMMSDFRDVSTDLRALVQGINDAQAVERLLAAVDGASEAAGAVKSSVEGVPELIESLTATAETARALPLEELIAQLTEVVDTADSLLSDQGTRDLPASLGATLDELRLALVELREGGAVASLNRTLASAGEAARAVEDAARSLPGVSNRLNAVLAQASETLDSIDGSSEIGRSARAALTEVSRAAKAIESLARTIERRPNSIILGR